MHAARNTPLSCGNRAGTNRKLRPKRQAGESYNPRSYHQAIRQGYLKAFPVLDEIVNNPDAIRKWRSEHKWCPLQLRQNAATFIRKTYGLEAAQTVLGHSRADITQVYAERDYTLAARVEREVG